MSAETEAPRPASRLPTMPIRSLLEHVAVGTAAVVWVLVLTRSSGGFHDERTGWLALTLIPAAVLTRPWRNIPMWLIALVVLAAAGAGLVLMVTPTGWAQGDSPAGQLLGLVALLVVAAYARTPQRRLAIVGVLIAALMLQFYEAWLPWWGSRDPNHLMVGTFYWHNQLAAWMVGTGLCAGAAAVAGPRELRLPALLVVPFADVAVVLSTSRTSLALLALGHLALVLIGLTCTDRWAATGRAIGMPIAGAVLLLALTSPVFFSDAHFKGPAATQAVSDGNSLTPRGTDSLALNGGDRVQWTKAAVKAWVDSPVMGDGFGSFIYTSDSRLPVGRQRSPFVHNGYAEALASGGLVFALPLLLLVIAVALRALGALWTGLRVRTAGRAIQMGAALSTLALLAHSGVDFDWHYSSLVVLVGVTGGLLFSPQEECRQYPTGRLRGLVSGLLVVAVLALSATASFVEHHGRLAQGRRSADAATTVRTLLDAQLGPLYDERLARAALGAGVATPAHGVDRLEVPPRLAREALERSRRAARLEPSTQVVRAEVMALLGDVRAARALADDVVRRHPNQPFLMASYAQVRYLDGSYPQARPAVARAAGQATDAGTAWELVSTLEHLDGTTPAPATRCAYAAAAARFGAAPTAVAPLPAPPTGQCPPPG